MNILIVLGIIILSIIGLIILLLMLLLLPHTCMGIEYLNANGQLKLVLLLFFFNKRIKIPMQILPALKKKAPKKKKVKKQVDKKEKASKFTFNKFNSDVGRFMKFYTAMGKDIKSAFSYIAKKTDFDEVKFYTNFGFSDPMETGIMTGSVWGAVNVILAFLNNVFGIRKVDLIVNPVYTKECFDVYFYCIIKLRLVHIITATVKITNAYSTFVKNNKK